MVAWPSGPTCLSFCVVAVASASISKHIKSATHLPLITGYILAGIVCGPFALRLLSAEQGKALAAVVNDDAMGFIGFSAGSKFLFSELNGSLRALFSLLAGLVLTTFTFVFTGVYLASPLLDLTASVPPPQKLAMALLIACLAVARSPSSAIALVSELDAHGPFTTAALSVTVLMDVVVVLLFALTMLLVHSICPEPGRAAPPIAQVLCLFAVQLVASLLLGVLLGWLLHHFISFAARTSTAASTPAPPPAAAPARPFKRRWGSVVFAGDGSGKDLLSGLAQPLADAKERILPRKENRQAAAVFASLVVGVKVSVVCAEFLIMQLAGFEIFEAERLEQQLFGVSFMMPLVIAMVAGAYIVNFTPSRKAFLRILHDSSDPVFVAFFTLTGANLQLDVLLSNLSTAALIFGLRLSGITVGSYAGGRLGGSDKLHYNRYWQAFVTQAGVALGLAQRIAAEFEWGPSLATTVVATVVVAQLLGPLLFKAAIVAVGEAHATSGKPAAHAATTRPPSRHALLVGAAGDAVGAGLHARLIARGWDVIRYDTARADEPRPAVDERLHRFREAVMRRRGGEASLRRLLRQADEASSLTKPLLADEEAGAALDDTQLEALLTEELRLAWAASCLPSLDAMILACPDDAENVRLCKMLSSSPHFSDLLQRQTSTTDKPQLLVRMSFATFEPTYKATAPKDFNLTCASERAAFANLLAECLHPECFWTLKLDNSLAS